MLVVSDPTFLSPLDPWPYFRSHQRPVQAAQSYCKVVKAMQIMIGPRGARTKAGEKIGGRGFGDWLVPYAIQCRIAVGSAIAFLRYGLPMRFISRITADQHLEGRSGSLAER